MLLSSILMAGDLGESLTINRAPLFREQFVPFAAQTNVLLEIGPTDIPHTLFNTLLIHGVLPDPNVQFEVSYKINSSTWSSWIKVDQHRKEKGRFWGKVEFPKNVKQALRFRLLNIGVQASHTVTLFDAEIFDRNEKEGFEKNREEISSTKIKDRFPELVSRVTWGAKSSKEKYVAHVPKRFTLHHTAGLQTFSIEESIQEIRFIQEFHMEGRGWNDIGYHFLVDSEGHVFEGRPDYAIGAHVKGGNTGNLGVVFLGYYHPPNDHEIHMNQVDRLIELGKYLTQLFDFSALTLRGHRDYNSTACPGDSVYPFIPFFMAEMLEE